MLTKFNADHPGHQAPLNPVIRHYPPPNTPRPQYSCPTCRVAVSMKPAEVYALKAIVRAVASVAGDSSPRKNTSIRKQLPESVWDRFFPKRKSTIY